MDIAEKNNAASRARNILQKALAHPDSSSTLSVWSEVLFEGSTKPTGTFEVLRLVESLHREIQLAERQLSSLGVPESIYRGHFLSAYSAVDVKNVNATWNNFKHYITKELLLCLSFSAFIIEENEPEFDQAQIVELEMLISELEEAIQSKSLDSSLSHFVEQQITLLRRGLNDYRVRGAKALSKCYVDGLGDIIENAETIKKHSASPVVEQVKTIWGHMQKATEHAATLNKSVETVYKVFENGNKLIESLSNIVSA